MGASLARRHIRGVNMGIVRRKMVLLGVVVVVRVISTVVPQVVVVTGTVLTALTEPEPVTVPNYLTERVVIPNIGSMKNVRMHIVLINTI